MTFEKQCHEMVSAAKAQPLECDHDTILSLLDHTCLKPKHALEELTQCRDKTNHIAAVCVNPENVALVKQMLTCSVASVINFPGGNLTASQIDRECQLVLDTEADEIDLVFPYQIYLQGRVNDALAIVQRVRKKCPNQLLKVILETSQFPSLDKIHHASLECIVNGADFIKTSTGVDHPGASLEAAAAILLTIKQLPSSHQVGLKISGGLSELDQLPPYFGLIAQIFDQDWITPSHFRIGASKLLDQLIP